MSAVTIHTPGLGLPRRPAVVLPFPRAGRAAPARPQQTTPARAALRLTRRGRLAVTLLVAAGVLVVALVGARSALAGPAAVSVAEPRVVQHVTVMPGDTLWSIASATSSGGDVRDRISAIREHNGLRSSQLAVGQTLVVPVG